jgi:hypothetical protein
MKKILIVVIVLLSKSASAQISYGISAGVNVNTAEVFYEPQKSWATYRKTESSTGFQINGFLLLDLSDKFSVRPTLGFVQKGFRYKEIKVPGVGIIPSAKVTMSCIHLAPVFSYKIINRVFIEAGPELTYHVDFKTEDPSLEDYKGKVEWSALFGARYSISKKIDFNIQYSLGLTDITDVKGYFENPNTNAVEEFGLVTKTSYLGLSVSYYLK